MKNVINNAETRTLNRACTIKEDNSVPIVNNLFLSQYQQLHSEWTERIKLLTDDISAYKTNHQSTDNNHVSNMTALTIEIKSQLIQLAQDDLDLLNDLWKLKRSLFKLSEIVWSDENEIMKSESSNASSLVNLKSSLSKQGHISDKRSQVVKDVFTLCPFPNRSNAVSSCGLLSTMPNSKNQRFKFTLTSPKPSTADFEVAAASELFQKMDKWKCDEIESALYEDYSRNSSYNMLHRTFDYFPKKRCSAVEIKRNFRRNEPQKRSFDSGFHEITSDTSYSDFEFSNGSKETLSTSIRKS
ncbi:hypothetical protein GJ496_004250 [Pomphorhynchus laevis]|nr:hypothetical protein GJ496_004250 [Pomphorhynchus laevis]